MQRVLPIFVIVSFDGSDFEAFLTSTANNARRISKATSHRRSDSSPGKVGCDCIVHHAPIVQPFSSLPPSHLLTSPPSEPITVLTLSNLTDNPGATHKSRRIGRGIGSSKGKTSGRGHKGQKSRAGRGVHPTFEGGQTKFYKRLPKVGRMKNAKFKLELIPLNIGRVQDYVTMGRLKPERGDGVLTMRDFVKAGMFPASSVKSGVKLLGGGREQLKDRLLIEVPWASSSAIEAVEKKGGYVTTVHHNRLAVRAALKPEKFPLKPESMVEEEEGKTANADVEDLYLLPKRASPPPKYMQYYTDYSKRGYLNPKVQLERKKLGLKEIH
ncbi:hypothetical protein ACHAXS_006517 [Conticribra weissflogii]